MLDLTDKIDEIVYATNYSRSQSDIKKLREVWGGAATNKCGVMEDHETVTIKRDGQFYADVHVVEAAPGMYAMATSWHLPIQGAGSMPSVWDRTAYETKDEAITAGLKELVGIFERVRESTHDHAGQVLKAGQFLEVFRERLKKADQFSLF